MQLFYSPSSPYVRKVMVLARELGVEWLDILAISGTLSAPDPALIARNPLGKIPALVRDDGPTLYDSRVICQFLDAQAGGSFYPTAPRLWDTLTVEATADGIMDAAILMVYEARIRPEERRFAPWVEGQWAKIDRALDVLETRWMDHLNSQLEMGQIAVACALEYLDLRHASREWRKGRPHLARWLEGFSQRDSMRATVPSA